ncbi:MAG: hypothetical protein BM557_02215 [Flavobacterium sp. MedPE-SWcel]|uniref:hypothetical protein n=1 Tax=uncultured Flavobacterium sp. TaxID=165435 RepID=UPI00090EFF01|nr:hypothetical protein [uncultured Flavobacterium sp.]OIQ22213.1 MAG: hypothetical protein BM557_02215 [Flavobacterium sp. MedPE-SWcel]
MSTNNSVIMQTLATIMASLNTLMGNSKKIDELPVQENVNLESKIHVSNNSNSQSLTLQKLAEKILKSQNNKGLYWYFGEVSGDGDITPEQAKTALNNVGYSISITEITTPVIFEFTRSGKKFLYIFIKGRGIWGSANGANVHPAISSSDLVFMSKTTLTNDDITSNDGATITDLGTLATGDYLTAVNSEPRDFSNSGALNEDGNIISHYFSYTQDGVLYFVQFVGAAGLYNSQNPLLEDDFVSSTNSSVEPNIEVQDATSEQKGILQLTGDLGGTSENPTVPNKVDKPSPLPSAGEIVVVGVDDQGNSTSIPTKEVFHVDQINTPYETINDLVNTGNYSTANGYTKGTQVICPGVIPPRVYLKIGDNDTNWIVFNGATIPLG